MSYTVNLTMPSVSVERLIELREKYGLAPAAAAAPTVARQRLAEATCRHGWPVGQSCPRCGRSIAATQAAQSALAELLAALTQRMIAYGTACHVIDQEIEDYPEGSPTADALQGASDRVRRLWSDVSNDLLALGSGQ